MNKLTLLLSATLCLLPGHRSWAADATATIPMRLSEVATYTVKARVGGLPAMAFMVDTGSGFMTINEATLAALQEAGQADYLRELRGVLADGSELQVPVYRLHRLALGNCELRDLEAAVFPGAKRQIIGLNALQQADAFTFSFDPPQLQLRNCPGADLLARAATE